jgi:RNA polymerase primary sigma factor
LLKGAEGLLVVDECHRSASEKNQDALDDRFNKRLGLSATHERMDGAHETVLLPYFERVAFTIGYDRAIADGVITNVRAAFVGVDFTEEECQQYQYYILELRALLRKLIREFGCPEGPFSAFLDAVVRLSSGGGGMKASITASSWLSKWRELLTETVAKHHAVLALIGAIDDADRTVLFTQSIASANGIADQLTQNGVPTRPHHSGLSSDERDLIMEQFAHGQLRVLSSVQTLEEGVDVPDADLAIIVASSKQRRQMIQRMGRVMRRKDDARDARFIILFVKDTEEDPRRGAQELFVDELLEVARESNIFGLDKTSELRRFLDPHRRQRTPPTLEVRPSSPTPRTSTHERPQ